MTNTIIRTEIRNNAYVLTYVRDGKEATALGKFTREFYNFKKYGFNSVEDMLLADIQNNLSNEAIKAINLSFRNDGFKEYKFKQTHEKIMKKLKAEGYSEDDAFEMAFDVMQENKSNISYKYLKNLNEEEIQNLKSNLNISADKAESVLSSFDVENTKKLKQFYSKFRTGFNWADFGLQLGVFKYNTILEDFSGVIAGHNRIILINQAEGIGYIFDAFDLFNILFDMDLEKILTTTNAKCKEFNAYKKEASFYEEALLIEEKLSEASLNMFEKASDVYYALVKKGQQVMNSNNFMNEKLVFTYPIKMICEDLDLEINQQNISVVADKINILCSMNIISKVFKDELLLNKMGHIVHETGKGYDCNYFMIKPFDFKMIDTLSRTLRRAKIRVKHISSSVIGKVLGKLFADEIFNKLYRKATPTESVEYDEEDDSDLEALFGINGACSAVFKNNS